MVSDQVVLAPVPHVSIMLTGNLPTPTGREGFSSSQLIHPAGFFVLLFYLLCYCLVDNVIGVVTVMFDVALLKMEQKDCYWSLYLYPDCEY